jgi:hypothetical protein
MPGEKDRPLPLPPKRAFGLHGHQEDREGQTLMADELARAAAEGRLDEFLCGEIPDNDYARALVSMMMGMTGMAPAGTTPAESELKSSSSDETAGPSGPPADVIDAVRGGDVQRLKSLLERERKRRSNPEEAAEPPKAEADEQVKPVIEKEIVDQLLKIASDNDLSPDWLFLRAIKLYVQEYQRTGRL